MLKLFKKRNIIFKTEEFCSIECPDTGLLLEYEDFTPKPKPVLKTVKPEKVKRESPMQAYSKKMEKQKELERKEPNFSFDSIDDLVFMDTPLELMEIEPVNKAHIEVFKELSKADLKLVNNIFPDETVRKDVRFSTGIIFKDITRNGVINYLNDSY